MPTYPKCGHKKGSFQCQTLSMRDVQAFHKSFYRKPDRSYQNNFVIQHVEIRNIKRRRPKQNKKPGDSVKAYKTQKRTTKYFVRNLNKTKVPVCLEAFKGILEISRFRINNITNQFHDDGIVKDKRGGFRKAAEFSIKKSCIMKYIEKLNCVEGHYCRGKSNRKYLPSELTIKKLWKMYLSEERNVPVKESYFRKIFNCNYNLGFGTPRTDVCSTCLSLNERIKHETNDKTKNNLLIDLRVHKLRAKAFYNKLKETNEKLLILSFDCQKNLPIPKLPDQSTYYSRQVYVQNFTVVQGNSNSPLSNLNTVRSYCWTENMFDRDSNMIASCVYDSLNSIELKNYTNVRLISDGCGGQNKNSIFIGMCSFWLVAVAPPHIQEMEIVYPVTGHSFLPSDRVFGFIEKKN